MPRLHCIKIMDMRQVREYQDSTVLTVLKWRMITMLNRKLLESTGYRTALLSMKYTQVTFYNVNATVSFGNCLNLNIHRTDKLTDRENQLLNPFAHVHVG